MNRKWLAKTLALLSAVCGTLILGSVLFPILSYELNLKDTDNFLSPVPEKENEVDYTKPANWFEKPYPETLSNIYFYKVSIPKLGIRGATVSIGGEDLSESLIQYPGTAAPGKLGNTVIFGHSILPQFYNPKDYTSIFSTLPTISKDDEIFIEYDGVSYRFRVEDKFEVRPTDLQILEQNPSDSFLTLVTCVPPGHPLRPKRLIVRARVVPI